MSDADNTGELPPRPHRGWTFDEQPVGRRWSTARRTITETDLIVYATQFGFGEGLFLDATAAERAGYVDATLDAFGRVDVLFNNAGIEGSYAPMIEYSEESLDQVRRAGGVPGIRRRQLHHRQPLPHRRGLQRRPLNCEQRTRGRVSQHPLGSGDRCRLMRQ